VRFNGLLAAILVCALSFLRVPGIVHGAGLSVQGLTQVEVTVLDCSGNPVPMAVVQLRGLSFGLWTYTDANGNAFLAVPAGTYTIQGGYGTFAFMQTTNVSTQYAQLTVNIGSGCNSSSLSSSSTSLSSTPINISIPRNRGPSTNFASD